MPRIKEPNSLRSIAEKAGLSHNAVAKLRKAGWPDDQIIERGKLKYAGTEPPKREHSRAKKILEKKAQEKPVEQVPPAAASDVEPGSYSEARLRTERANAKLKELEIAEREGRLVDSEILAKVWGDFAARIRDEFLAIPDRIALKLDGQPYKVIRETMMTEIRQTLQLLHQEVKGEAA